ncbi:hypothetical protein QBC40DRAFT_277143 [Triangularia verruculosa]|uniref:Uncharacterized protein n=1 Tax=Triangularia verruculosa TaxID=2587418 RepID=A0AAN6XKU1_9PEZI|nr:hypothetical protein QBC40DRAFT_277143 [Triangularia verruculosa]
MEFLSAADTAAGLLGTLKATADATRLFYARAKHAGEALHDNHLGFDKCHTALEMWIRFWRLDERLSRRYQQTLWGPDGARTIGRQLAKIQSQMGDVWDELSPLLARAGISRMTTSQVDWSSTLESRRGIAKIRSLLRKRDLWWFARGKGDELLSLINSVWVSIGDLRELSLTCFSMVNGSSLLDQPPDVLASVVGLKSFTSAILDAKTAASMYFSALFNMLRTGASSASLRPPNPTIAHLDIDLVKNKFLDPQNFQSFDNILVRYSLSIFSGRQNSYSQPLLVLVDGPHKMTASHARPTEEVPVVQKDLGIRDAVAAARQSTTSIFTVRSSDDTLEACFRVLPPQPDQLLNLSPSRPPETKSNLSDFLYPLPFDKLSSRKEDAMMLPLSARIRLARDLVLMGLFLGGTPWLSGAKESIGKMMRPDFSESGDIQRFLLEIEVDTAVTRLRKVQEWRQHLHSVGLTLLELGMGMQLREIVEYDRGTGSSIFVFHRKRLPRGLASRWIQRLVEFLSNFIFDPLLSRLSFANTPSHVKLSWERVNVLLTMAMGEQYAATVRQLLHRELWKNQGASGDMKEVAKTCWQEVYLRMEEVAKAMELDPTPERWTKVYEAEETGTWSGLRRRAPVL